jgi:hypothetical protein
MGTIRKLTENSLNKRKKCEIICCLDLGVLELPKVITNNILHLKHFNFQKQKLTPLQNKVIIKPASWFR